MRVIKQSYPSCCSDEGLEGVLKELPDVVNKAERREIILYAFKK